MRLEHVFLFLFSVIFFLHHSSTNCIIFHSFINTSVTVYLIPLCLLPFCPQRHVNSLTSCAHRRESNVLHPEPLPASWTRCSIDEQHHLLYSLLLLPMFFFEVFTNSVFLCSWLEITSRSRASVPHSSATTLKS